MIELEPYAEAILPELIKFTRENSRELLTNNHKTIIRVAQYLHAEQKISDDEVEVYLNLDNYKSKYIILKTISLLALKSKAKNLLIELLLKKMQL